MISLPHSAEGTVRRHRGHQHRRHLRLHRLKREWSIDVLSCSSDTKDGFGKPRSHPAQLKRNRRKSVLFITWISCIRNITVIVDTARPRSLCKCSTPRHIIIIIFIFVVVSISVVDVVSVLLRWSVLVGLVQHVATDV